MNGPNARNGPGNAEVAGAVQVPDNARKCKNAC